MLSQASIRRFTQDAPAMFQTRFREDAESLPFLERQLTQTLSEVFRVQYPNLEMIEGAVVPIDTSIDPGANFFEWIMLDGTAMARFVTSYASNDMPMTTLSSSRHVSPLHSIELGFGYTTQDLRAAAFAGMDLPSENAELCRRGHYEKHNRVALWGSKKRGLFGFVNHPNVPEFAPLPDPDMSGETRWKLKNPLLVAKDVANMKAAVRKITKGVHRVNRIVMADDTYEVLSSTPMAVTAGGFTTFNSQTVLSYLISVNPDITFGSIRDLAADESEGNLGEDVVIAFQGGDKRVVSYVMPLDFTMHDIQWAGLMARIPCESRSGGIVWRYPLSAVRMRNV